MSEKQPKGRTTTKGGRRPLHVTPWWQCLLGPPLSRSVCLRNKHLLCQERKVPWAQLTALDIFAGNQTIGSMVSFATSGLSGSPSSCDFHAVTKSASIFKSLYNFFPFLFNSKIIILIQVFLISCPGTI